MKKIIYIMFTVLMLYLFFKWEIYALFLWAVIEVIIFSFKDKNSHIISFICNFVTTILIGINYVINGLLYIPANRLLITPQGDKFGNPHKRFTQILRINIVKGTAKPRGIFLFKILESITNFGRHE